MKIKSFSEVEDQDKIYTVVLSNKSEHFVPGKIIMDMISTPLGSMMRVPSGSFINRSHIIEIKYYPEGTVDFVKKSKELCDKYELEYRGGAPYDYQLSNGYTMI